MNLYLFQSAGVPADYPNKPPALRKVSARLGAGPRPPRLAAARPRAPGNRRARSTRRAAPLGGATHLLQLVARRLAPKRYKIQVAAPIMELRAVPNNANAYHHRGPENLVRLLDGSSLVSTLTDAPFEGDSYALSR